MDRKPPFLAILNTLIFTKYSLIDWPTVSLYTYSNTVIVFLSICHHCSQEEHDNHPGLDEPDCYYWYLFKLVILMEIYDRVVKNSECVLWFKNNVCKQLLNGRATCFSCLSKPVCLHSIKCQLICTASQLTFLDLI